VNQFSTEVQGLVAQKVEIKGGNKMKRGENSGRREELISFMLVLLLRKRRWECSCKVEQIV